MSTYKEIPIDIAYRLVNHGPVVMVSTKSPEGVYDIAPVAWNCPVRKSPSKILIGLGKTHKTYENIKSTGKFIICIPNLSSAEFVRYCGSVSGADENKFKKFPVNTEKGEKADALIPEGFTGYIECALDGEFQVGSVAMIIGEALKAGASKDGFTDRVSPEKESGRTIHHLGGGVFGILSPEVNEK